MVVSAPAVSLRPVLYSFRRCPYAMRARLAVAVSGTPVALREVVLARKPPALLQASPKGTVPVLVLPDGTVLEQSLDIMWWALRTSDPLHWLPQNDAALQAALQWIAQCDGPFKQQLDAYKYPQRQGLIDGSGARGQASTFLTQLNQQIADHGFLSGAAMGLADMAIAPFVRQFAHVDPIWFSQQPWPGLQTWLTTFEASDLFARVMDKYPAWEPGQPELHFP